MKTFKVAPFIGTFFVLLFTSTAAYADVTVEITQQSQFDVFGETTIIKPGNNPFIIPETEYSNTQLKPGQYSILIDPPSGSEPRTTLYIDGELQADKNGGRITFVLEEGQTAFVNILHDYNRLGMVTVSSDPQNVPFTLTGPDGLQWQGVTPKEYQNLPEGQYNVLYGELKGCGAQKKLSDKLVKNGRVAFVMDYVCATADEMRKQESGADAETVAVKVNNELITFTDVGLNEWYTDYIKTVVRGGLLDGYTNEKGELTGEFGPSDPVNLAQLAKVAHNITDIDANAVRVEVQNPRAKGQWFEKYYASAEQQYWLAFIMKNENPGRNATRAEVIGTFMQALGKERIWPTGTVFSDVLVFSKYADAIEIAARDGIIDGSAETFRPNDPINRAELAKILQQISETYFVEAD